MEDEGVVGEWGNFRFKMIQPQDQDKVLQHLRDHLYELAWEGMGYTKDADDEIELAFIKILNGGHNLSFFAEDKASGKLAGCRVITIESMSHDDSAEPLIKNHALRGILKLYDRLKEECKLSDRYKVDFYPRMFGISVDPEFRQQGLATEIYCRAKGLLKAKGFVFPFLGFSSAFSRAAAKHHGFIQLAYTPFLQALDDQGNPLNPQANPADFLDMGVIEL